MARLGMALLLAALFGACDPAKLRHTPDATQVVIDGPPDAVPHGPVTVKVYDPNSPGTIVVGIPVVFVDPDGTVVGRPVTDASGVATADVHFGASATSVIAMSNDTSMTTIVGLQPGDNIILNQSQATGMNGTFTASYPTYPGATYYYLYGPCGSSSGANQSTLTMYPYCTQSTMDLIVVAYDSGFNPLAFLEKQGVSYTSGGTTAITGTYSGTSTFNVSYTNVDPAITNIYMNRTVPANIGFGQGQSGVPMSGSLALSTRTIQGQTASVQTQVTKGQYSNIVIQNISGNALTYGLDVGGSLLPWLGPVNFDLANKKAFIPTDTTGTTNDKPDFFYLSLSYSRPNGANNSSYHWLIISPEIADVALPPLPPEVGNVLPQPTDNLGFSYAVALESTALTWDMVRSDAFDTFNSIGYGADTTTKLRESLFQIGD